MCRTQGGHRHAAAEMAGIVVVRGSLRSTAPVRRPLPSSAINDLAYIIRLYIWGSGKPSRYGQACACGSDSGGNGEPVVAMARLVVVAGTGVMVWCRAAVHYIMGLWCKKLLMERLLGVTDTVIQDPSVRYALML